MSATMSPADLTHGTESAYRYHGCRCEPCRAGRAERARAYNARRPRPQRKARKRRPIEHGTIYAYTTYQCRCSECREARAAYQRDYRARLAGAQTAPRASRATPAPAHPEVRALLRSRLRALSVAPSTIETRARRAEVRSLLDHLDAEVTA